MENGGVVKCDMEIGKVGKDVAHYVQISKPLVLGRVYLNLTTSYFVFGETPPKRIRVTVEEIPES